MHRSRVTVVGLAELSPLGEPQAIRCVQRWPTPSTLTRRLDHDCDSGERGRAFRRLASVIPIAAIASSARTPAKIQT